MSFSRQYSTRLLYKFNLVKKRKHSPILYNFGYLAQMPGLKHILLPLFFISICTSQVLLEENFNNLKNWSHLTFPKISNHTDYSIKGIDGNFILVVQTDNSASGLVFSETFDVTEYPVLKWRWKVSNVYKNGNAKEKSGDDYPACIYVMFEYNPDKVGFFESAMYKTYRLIYGEYPPYNSLNYIWTSREYSEYVLPNPYTEKAQMIPIQEGNGQVGIWIEEEVHILHDYRTVFGEDPPGRASIAIMSDSDDTGESATAYIDYLEIRSE